MKNLSVYFSFLLTLIVVNILAVSNCYGQELVIDHEGNSYNTIKIGDQLWMAENLNTVHYANGEKIQSYCYDHDIAYCKIFGRLYTWQSLHIGEKSDSLLGICPDGWHIPTDEEWGIMLDSVGGFKIAGTVLRRGKYSHFKLKWGGNYQSELDIYSYIDRKVYFWSATEFSKTAAWMRMTSANTKNFNRSTVPKEFAFSIRCIKN